MLRIVPPTVPLVGRSDEHFPDGFELHLLHTRPYRQLRRAGRPAGKLTFIERCEVYRVVALLRATEGPSWGYPVFVLGAVCLFLWGNIVKR